MPGNLRHFTAPGFWKSYYALPEHIQVQAKKQYQVMKADPYHPSLRFQPKSGSNFWAARVNLDYRALAYYQGEGCYLWVWIGTHREYERLLTQ